MVLGLRSPWLSREKVLGWLRVLLKIHSDKWLQWIWAGIVNVTFKILPFRRHNQSDRLAICLSHIWCPAQAQARLNCAEEQFTCGIAELTSIKTPKLDQLMHHRNRDWYSRSENPQLCKTCLPSYKCGFSQSTDTITSNPSVKKLRARVTTSAAAASSGAPITKYTGDGSPAVYRHRPHEIGCEISKPCHCSQRSGFTLL